MLTAIDDANRLSDRVIIIVLIIGEVTRHLLFLCDQSMVPSQNRFRSNDTRQLTQASKSPYVSFDRQPPTLVIVQENPLLPDNLPQDKVLSSQVFDRFLLISVNGTDRENGTSFDQTAGAIWRGGRFVSFGITFLNLFSSLRLLLFFFRRSFLLGNSLSCSQCGGVFRLNCLIQF